MKKSAYLLSALLFLLISGFLFCEKPPTAPEVIPDEEVHKIPFDRLTGKIAFRRWLQERGNEYNLLVIDGDEHSLTNKALFYPYIPANFQFSPDGLQVLFSYYIYNYDILNYQWQIFIMDMNTLELTDFSPSFFDDSYPSWSPDGKKIAFWSTRDYVSGIWIQELGADTAQFLAEVHVIARTRPAFSPDGNELYMSSLDSVGRAILLKTELSKIGFLDTLLVSEEDSAAVVYKHLAMSPEGNRLAFVRAQDSGIDEIWIYNLTDKSLTKLTTGFADWHPTWSPDGKQLLFSRGRNLYIMNDDGAEVEQVTFGKNNYDEYPTWIK